MFTDLVSTLTLDKTRIIYPNFATNNLDIRKIMVKDLFKSWDTKGNNTYPDFYIRGLELMILVPIIYISLESQKEPQKIVMP